jgi:hypothetical protein
MNSMLRQGSKTEKSHFCRSNDILFVGQNWCWSVKWVVGQIACGFKCCRSKVNVPRWARSQSYKTFFAVIYGIISVTSVNLTSHPLCNIYRGYADFCVNYTELSFIENGQITIYSLFWCNWKSIISWTVCPLTKLHTIFVTLRVPYQERDYSFQGILKGEVSLYRWPPVWLVWNQLYDNWQLLFLFAKQTNPNQSNRRSMVQWYSPL